MLSSNDIPGRAGLSFSISVDDVMLVILMPAPPFRSISGTSSRNFDLHVQCKTVAGEPGREFSFSAIDRKEYQPLIDFFSTKKNIRIKNLREAEVRRLNPNLLDSLVH